MLHKFEGHFQVYDSNIYGIVLSIPRHDPDYVIISYQDFISNIITELQIVLCFMRVLLVYIL